MAMKTLLQSKELQTYMTSLNHGESIILSELRKATEKLPEGVMLSTPDQVRFLQWLIHLLKARKVLEIGTFTGYSALSMALAMGKNGKVITLDKEKAWAEIALEFWKMAGVDKQIQFKPGVAHETLLAMTKDESNFNSFDLIYIDADKQRGRDYLEYAILFLKINGMVVMDNVFWSGKVSDPANSQATTEYIREMNSAISNDTRLRSFFLPLGDGMMCAVKV